MDLGRSIKNAHYYDGQTARGTAVQLKTDSQFLHIYSIETEGHIDSWRVGNIRSSSNLATTTVLVSTVSKGEIHLSTQDFVLFVQPFVPKFSLPDKLNLSTKTNRKLLGLTALAAGVISVFYFGVQLGASQIARMTPFSIEKQIFDSEGLGFQELALCEADGGSEALQNLASLLSGPQVSKDFELQVNIIEMKIANAFALPGGKILVTTGLLAEAESLDEVAGVLAHEIQHVVQRHPLANFIRHYAFTYLGSFVFGGGSSLDFNRIAGGLMQLKFSRSDEASADHGAVGMIDRAGFSREGVADFFRRHDSAAENALGFLSTHPSSQKRVEEILNLDNLMGKKIKIRKTSQNQKILRALKTSCAEKK